MISRASWMLGIGALAGALGAGCQVPRTEVMLMVSADLPVPAGLDRIRVSVTSENQTVALAQTFDLGPMKTKLPFSIALVPGDDKSVAFRVVVTGFLQGTRIVERSALTSFVPERSLLLRLDLLEVCRGVTCAEGQTCLPQGRCDADGLDPHDLPSLKPDRDAAQPSDSGPADASSELIGDLLGDLPPDELDPETPKLDSPLDPAPDLSSDLPADLPPDLPAEPIDPPPDAPVESSADLAPDVPPDVPGDVPIDPGIDLAPDVPPDLPPPDSPPGTSPSCAGLAPACGPMSAESCCVSPMVPAGSFNRGNDPMYPATLSSFRLDRFEATVGRFRKFVEAGMGTASTAPGAGAGANPNASGTGWDPTWNANLKPDTAALKSALKCDAMLGTWTDVPGGNENRPVNCIDWYEAFAFCIWDGGRLPSEAEWNYAAAGGSAQRTYPWGSAGPDSTRASYWVDSLKQCYGDGIPGCDVTDLINVGTKPAGDGKWGHAEMAGNAYEWVFDSWATTYSNPCVDCAVSTPSGNRDMRGSSFRFGPAALVTSDRNYLTPSVHDNMIGVRCARAP